jgi:hypothetical protein
VKGRWGGAGALACAAAVALGGCQSTVQKAKKVAASSAAAFGGPAHGVDATDATIKVLASTIVRDANGTAVVVELRNTGSRVVGNAPIDVDLRDRAGKSVFRNDAAGLAASLTHVPALPAGARVTWVDDQVTPTATPRRVIVRVGRGRPGVDAAPAPTASRAALSGDPTSGIQASGTVRNPSEVALRDVTVSVVARRDGRIVAAGRAVVDRLAPEQSAPYHAYLIGDPGHSRLQIGAAVQPAAKPRWSSCDGSAGTPQTSARCHRRAAPARCCARGR